MIFTGLCGLTLPICYSDVKYMNVKKTGILLLIRASSTQFYFNKKEYNIAKKLPYAIKNNWVFCLRIFEVTLEKIVDVCSILLKKSELNSPYNYLL